jgi:hypothetical protein
MVDAIGKIQTGGNDPDTLEGTDGNAMLSGLGGDAVLLGFGGDVGNPPADWDDLVEQVVASSRRER